MKQEKAVIAFHSMRAKASANGYMSEEEIEAEIAAARRKGDCMNLMDKNEVPNAVTLKAMEDAENEVGMSVAFASVKDLMDALNEEVIEETEKEQDTKKQSVQRKNIEEFFSGFDGGMSQLK